MFELLSDLQVIRNVSWSMALWSLQPDALRAVEANARCCEMMKKGTKFVLHSNFEEKNFFFFNR